MIVNIQDDWQPTASNIAELPGPVRRFIIELQANNSRETAQLRKELASLKRDIRLRAAVMDIPE